MIFQHNRVIYGFECDLYGHLNNARYLHLYEEARDELLRKTGLRQIDWLQHDIQLIVSEIHLRFLIPILTDDQVVIETEIVSMNRVRYHWKQRIVNVRGDTSSDLDLHGAFTRQGKPVRIPADFLERFTPWMID